MHVMMTLFTAALFFVLTPGILLTLPRHGTKYAVALTHGLAFALVYHFTHKAFYMYVYGEGFDGNPMYKPCGASTSPSGVSTGENAPRPNCT